MPREENRRIEVVSHNPDWMRLFNKESNLIKNLMGDLIIKIHHIGSTAIPKIKAKPIIDIAPEVKDINEIESFYREMEGFGYVAYGEYGIIGRRFFVKFNENDERIVNAHFFQTQHPELKQHLLFRDFMNSNPFDAEKYSKLKEELAARFPYDIDSYCNGKDLFVKEILAKAGFDEMFLREVRTESEWFHYHRIRKAELFDAYMPDIIYDKNHPSITSPNTKHYVFYKGPRIIGTIFTDRKSKTSVVLRLLAIDGGFKNKGYGSVLIKQIEDVIKNEGYKTILVHVNRPAYNFYKRNGYSEMDFDEETYADSIKMGKRI